MVFADSARLVHTSVRPFISHLDEQEVDLANERSSVPAPQYVTYGPPSGMPGPMPTILAAAAVQQQPLGFKPSQQKAMKILAAFHVVIGISCVIINIVLLSIKRESVYVDSVSAGIWCGAVYIIAGILGLAAALKNKMSLIVSALVISIISTVLLWVVVGISSGAIDQSVNLQRNPCSGNRYDRYSFFMLTCYVPNYSGYKAADSIMLVLSFAELIVSIWSAVLCCKGSCGKCCSCCCYCCDHAHQAPAIYYATAQSAGPQVIILPQSSMLGGQAIGLMSAQQGYQFGQQQVLFAPPASVAAYGQPGSFVQGATGMYKPPEYSVAQAGASASDLSGEISKEQMAAGY